MNIKALYAHVNIFNIQRRPNFLLLCFILVLPVLLLSCDTNTSDTVDSSLDNRITHSSAISGFSWEIPRVPNIAEQFISISGVSGYPFTFRYWNNQMLSTGIFIGDDPTVCAHYQGMNRVQAPDGTAYLYLTRNGNPTFICSGTYADYPGEILIVKMDDRNKTGAAFGIDPQNDIFGYQQPRANDFTVLSKHLNGIDFEWLPSPGVDLSQFIDWKHPGSGQQAGDRLFIPVEKTCNYEPENEKCGGGEEGRGAILVLKLADNLDSTVSPANPKVDCQIDFYWDSMLSDARALPKIGNLAVTKKGNDYLFAHTTGGGYNKETALTFYEVNQDNLCDFNPVPERPDIIAPIVYKIHDWNADWLLSDDTEHLGEDGWRKDQSCNGCNFDWQMINFFYDNNNDLYLLTTDKSSIVDVYHDFARLYKILHNPDLNLYGVKYIAEKHFFLSSTNFYGSDADFDMGSYKAIGSAYISPEGRLIVYSGSHDNDLSAFIYDSTTGATCNGSDLCKGLGLGEFASTYFHPPDITAADAQTTDEGSSTLFQLGSFTDTVIDSQSWDVVIDWGDNNQSSFTAVPGSLPPLEHIYADGPATYTVTIKISDSDGYIGYGEFTVTVNNVAPLVSIDSITPIILVGDPVRLDGSFIDPGNIDTHLAEIDWGDGSGFIPTTINPATNTVSDNYTYASTNTYTVTLKVTDKDGDAGNDTASILVTTPIDGLMWLCDALGDIAYHSTLDARAIHHINKAIGHLCGNNEYLAENGAVDKLRKENLNAALVKLDLVLRHLNLAEDEDNSLDLQVHKDFIELVASKI